MDQAFRNFLREKRDAIATKWRESVLDAYPPQAARFMGREPDPFANPVGQTTFRVIEAVLDHLAAGGKVEEAAPLVEDVLRMRAVQSLLPSAALGFLFQLKQVIRSELGVERMDPALWRSLLDFESHLDGLALKCFDTYLGCREKVYDIKATELRRRSQRVLEKLNQRLLGGGCTDEEPVLMAPPPNSERGGTT